MFLSSKSSEFLKWATQKENNIPKNINEISVEIKDINRTTKMKYLKLDQHWIDSTVVCIEVIEI